MLACAGHCGANRRLAVLDVVAAGFLAAIDLAVLPLGQPWLASAVTGSLLWWRPAPENGDLCPVRAASRGRKHRELIQYL